MNLQKCYLTNNDCYKTGKYITVKGLMLHSTGANNPNLKRYVQPNDGQLGTNTNNNDWNRPLPDGTQKCVHGFIGLLESKEVATYQTLPWDMRGWHCGGTANNTHIGVEICEDGLTDSVYFNKVYKESVELFAYLCKYYLLDPLTQIICHSEGYKLGVASNHSDVMHWFPKHGKSMDTFRQDVYNELNKNNEEIIEEVEEIDEKMLSYEEFKEYMTKYNTEVNNKTVSSYAKDDFKATTDSGVLNGLYPQAPLSRQDFSVLCVRLGLNKLSTEKPSSKWFVDNWEKLTEYGVVDGTQPKAPVTRDELVNILIRYIEFLKEE